MNAGLAKLWKSSEDAGSEAFRERICVLMPMPGEIEFDDDERFLKIQLFPGVLASSNQWTMPDRWYRDPLLEVQGYRVINFDIPLGNSESLVEKANRSHLLAVKRVIYLLLFRPYTRPFAPNTLRQIKRLVLQVPQWINEFGPKNGVTKIAHLSDFKKLAAFVEGLDVTSRSQLPNLYSVLRWWVRRAPKSYGFFIPPPSVDSFIGAKSFNPGKVRVDAPRKEGKAFLRLPNSYIAEGGKCWLDHCEVILPELLEVLKELRKSGLVGRPLHKRAKDILAGREWPNFNWPFRKPKSTRDLVSLSFHCQSSAIQLMSLLLGPRWSEVRPMTQGCVSSQVIAGLSIDVLDTRTFKASQSISGAPVKWPIGSRLGKILKRQMELSRLLNGEDWPYVWTGFSKTLFGKPIPCRQIDSSLKRFSRRHLLDRFLDGTKLHHHRFRSTVAYLVVVALNGGPFILRELFGHETLAMTMHYVLSNRELQDELRVIADEEMRATSADYLGESGSLRGGGATNLRSVLANVSEFAEIAVPAGRRDQERLSAEELLDFIASESDGLTVIQIVPGVVACFRPVLEAGLCAREGKPTDIAVCDKGCRWNLLKNGPGAELGRQNILDAISNLRLHQGNTFAQSIWVRVIKRWVAEYPELKSQFSHDSDFNFALGVPDG